MNINDIKQKRITIIVIVHILQKCVPSIFFCCTNITFFKSSLLYIICTQRPKKVLSDSPGLVDFAIGLVNSVFNLPDEQVMFYEKFE